MKIVSNRLKYHFPFNGGACITRENIVNFHLKVIVICELQKGKMKTLTCYFLYHVECW